MLCVADGSVSAFTIFRGGNLKTFYIAEILTPAIAPTLDMICTAKLGCNLYISADWLGPGALQMLVELGKHKNQDFQKKPLIRNTSYCFSSSFLSKLTCICNFYLINKGDKRSTPAAIYRSWPYFLLFPSADSSSFRVDTAVIKQRVPILLKYLDSDTEKELQALYALQASIVKLDQPPSKCTGVLNPDSLRKSCFC